MNIEKGWWKGATSRRTGQGARSIKFISCFSLFDYAALEKLIIA
ncbi:hypothetical protein [Reichenbachiella faecimaris]|nr:hypothetical protein [Reichenbachiella faecimaris]